MKVKERMCRCLSFLLSVLIIPSVAAAANHYVRAGASGNGSDWTNAFNDLPASLIRGDTYYVAAGTYGGTNGWNLFTPTSGTTTITIKKATVADHGTSTGWSDSFANGQAITSNLAFGSSNWVVDGNGAATTASTTGQGIKVDCALQNIPNQQCNAVYFAPEATNTNITIRSVELKGRGQNFSRADDGFHLVASTGSISNVTISHCYVHDTGPGGAPIKSVSADNITMEYTWIARNSSTGPAHSEGWSTAGGNNLTLRYSVFEDVQGTGLVVSLNGTCCFTNQGFQIYGNVFFYNNGNPTGAGLGGDGAITCINGNTANNWVVYNNSFINLGVAGNNVGVTLSACGGTGNVNENNIWYGGPAAVHNGFNTNDYNYYSNISHTPAEAHEQVTNANPFVNWTSHDFHLVGPTTAGLTLAAAFNTDPDGNLRLAGSWDRGAYQFNGAAGRPNPPQNLRVTTVH